MASSGANGPWGPLDYDDLLKQADARLGATPDRSRRATPDPMTQPSPSAPRPFVTDGPPFEAPPQRRPGRAPRAATAVASPAGRRRRGQGLSWVSVLLALAASAVVGYACFSSLATAGPTAAELQRAWDWLSVVLVGLVGALVALVCSVVALSRARPKVVAACALVLALFLPVVAALIGFKLGATELVRHTSATASGLGTELTPVVVEFLRARGVDPGPLLALLERLLG